MENLIVYDKGKAKEYLDKIASIYARCSEGFTTNDDGTRTKLRISPVSFPKVGDDTVAVRMTGEVPILGVLTVDFVLIREGDVLLGAVNLAFGLAGVDSAINEQLVRKAHGRLVAALH